MPLPLACSSLTNSTSPGLAAHEAGGEPHGRLRATVAAGAPGPAAQEAGSEPRVAAVAAGAPGLAAHKACDELRAGGGARRR